MKLILANLLLLSAVSHSALITWDAGAGADRSWENGTNWSDDAAPAAGNDYVVSGINIIRPPTPPNSGSGSTYTFGGDSLTIGSGATLMPYRFDDDTGRFVNLNIGNLTVAGGTIETYTGYSSSHVTFNSAIHFSGGGTLKLNTAYGDYSHNLSLNGGITGDGSLSVQRTSMGSARQLIVNGASSSFTGDWALSGGLSGDILTVSFESGSGGWGTGDVTAANYTTLNIRSAFTAADSQLALGTTGSTLALDSSFTVGGLSIGGTPVANGTYDATSLSALGLGGTYTGTGNLTVVPEPSAPLLILIPAIAMMSIRRRPDRR